MSDEQADTLASQFHLAYETLAPTHSYETRPESAKPWSDVPAENKALMIDVMKHLFTCDSDGQPRYDPGS